MKGLFERRWCSPKQTYNWIAAKRRINRHDLYGESAAGRLTAQRRAGLLVRKVRFGSADNKYSMKSRFLRLTSRSVCAFWATKRTKESNYITDRIFGLIKRDSVSCLMTFEKTNAIERCTKTQPSHLCKTQIYQRNFKKHPTKRLHFVRISEGLFLNEELHKNNALNLCKATKIKKFFNQGSKMPSPSGDK